MPTAAAAQARRSVLVASVGGATIGHADSQQGAAPIFGGGAGFHLTPRLMVEGDVHGGRVTQVFGREDHDFSQVTLTGSALFRSSSEKRLHFIGGGGLALQRARSRFTVTSGERIHRSEVIRLLHGRSGLEWSLSNRSVMRAEGVLWFGSGLDWVMGARVSVGFRF